MLQNNNESNYLPRLRNTRLIVNGKQKNKKKSEIDREEKKKNISTLESDESKNIILSDQKILADLQRETKDILIRNRSDGRNQKSKRCSFKWDGIDSSSFILPRKSISKQKPILRRPKTASILPRKSQLSLRYHESQNNANCHTQNNVSHDVKDTDSLFFADGSSNTRQLRLVVSDAIKTTRFDSTSALLLSSGINVISDRNSYNGKLSRRPQTVHSCSSLSLRDVTGIKCPAVQDNAMENQEQKGLFCNSPSANEKSSIGKDDTGDLWCFNCWSAGYNEEKVGFKKCMLRHEIPTQNSDKIDRSLLSCSNWDINRLRRRYRGEERQEILMQTDTALKYDIFQRTFCKAVEYRHPIYRLLQSKINKCNYLRYRNWRVKIWFRSFCDVVASCNKFETRNLQSLRSLRRYIEINELNRVTRRHHPKPPLMRSSLINVNKRSERVVLVLDNPSKSNMKKIFPFSEFKEEYSCSCDMTDDLENNISLDMSYNNQNDIIHYFVRQLLERCLHDTAHQLLESSDINNCQFDKSVTKSSGNLNMPYGKPNIKFSASFVKFKYKENEIAVSQFVSVCGYVTTRTPSQYGGYHCLNNTLIFKPTKNREEKVVQDKKNIAEQCRDYETLPISFVKQPIFDPLKDRFPLPVIVKAGLECKDRYNHHDKTRVRKAIRSGFRLSVSHETLSINSSERATKDIIPSNSIVSANSPRVCPPVLANKDISTKYYSCPHRNTTSMYFFDILKRHNVYTLGKPQTFTCIGKQMQGKFLDEGNLSFSKGAFICNVHRSWTFLQKHTKQMYLSDKNEEYWYDHNTRQTFWTRPPYEEENIPVRSGGTIVVSKFKIASNRCRYQLRHNMIRKHETSDMRDRRIHDVLQALGRPSESAFDYNDNKWLQLECFEDEIVNDKSASFIESAPPCMIPFVTQANEKYPVQKLEVKQVNEKYSNREFKNQEQEENTLDKPLNEDPKNDLKSEDVQSQSSNASNLTESNYSNAIVDMITSTMENALIDKRPKDILQIGMGLGASLGAQGFLKLRQGMVVPASNNVNSVDENKDHKYDSDVESDHSVYHYSDSSMNISVNEKLNDNHAKQESIPVINHNTLKDLNSGLSTEATICSDQVNQKFEVRNEDVIFVQQKQDLSVKDILCCSKTEDNAHIDQCNLLASIKSSHVGQMYVEYIPSSLTYPLPRPAGRLKPRSVVEDWNAIGYDPWSAGRELLSVEIVRTLKNDQRISTYFKRSSTVSLKPEEVERNVIDYGTAIRGKTVENISNERVEEEHSFAMLCSYVRHGKYKEIESTMDDPEWCLPIDFADSASGNTLLMISCQNGNKRITKLCLRRGSHINQQNLNGQTCLHFAFGYGFDQLGHYLIGKGADDSITNAEGLTCYEGIKYNELDVI